MQERISKLFVCAILAPVIRLGAARSARAQDAQTPYPTMAPLDQYLMTDRNSEIALARSAAPGFVSDGAEVLVLGREGYKTAVKGTNGFLCNGQVGGGEHGSDGILESEDACTALLQRASREELCARLSDEDQTREQTELDVMRSWASDPVVLLEATGDASGTHEGHGKSGRSN